MVSKWKLKYTYHICTLTDTTICVKFMHTYIKSIEIWTHVIVEAHMQVHALKGTKISSVGT